MKPLQIAVTPHQFLKIQEFSERLQNRSIDIWEYKLLLEGMGLPVKKIVEYSFAGISAELVVTNSDGDGAYFTAPTHYLPVQYPAFRLRVLKSAANTL